MRGAMPCNPTQLWNRLSPTWQTRIRADLTALFQEVIDAQCRPDYAPTWGRTSSRVTNRHLTTSQYGHSLSENTCFATPGQRLVAQAVPRLQKCAENPIAMRYDTETYF